MEGRSNGCRDALSVLIAFLLLCFCSIKKKCQDALTSWRLSFARDMLQRVLVRLARPDNSLELKQLVVYSPSMRLRRHTGNYFNISVLIRGKPASEVTVVADIILCRSGFSRKAEVWASVKVAVRSGKIHLLLSWLLRLTTEAPERRLERTKRFGIVLSLPRRMSGARADPLRTCKQIHP